MTTKEQVLSLFEENRGTYFSGEDMAKRLGVSRAAIWKAVNGLRQDGYAVDAVTNKGYCLSENTDILSATGIQGYWKDSNIRLEIEDTVCSTNTLVRERANRGEAEGYVLLANEQTEGEGRTNRFFYSPKNTGVYLSVLLRPQRAITAMTTMAAAAMCEAIHEVSGRDAKIKWVNDIFVNEKKVCGILTEGAFGMETGQLEYAVLGVGVNLYPPVDGFPEDLREIAGAVFEKSGGDQKNRLVASFLRRFFRYYRADDQTAYIEAYRAESMVVGKKITVVSPVGEYSARAIGIDNQCRLQVQYEDGTCETLSYGEIRVKL